MVERVLSHRLQQAVAGARLAVFDENERLVDQRAEQVEHREALEALAGSHLLRQVERPAAGEYGQPAQQLALVLLEQLIAPVDRRSQRLLARQRASRPAGQQAEAIGERRGDLLDGHQPHPRGGELDRQRYAVQRMADAGHGSRVVVADGEVRADLQCALDEEPDGIGLRQPLDRLGHALGGQRQRRHPPARLSGDAQRGAAGGEDRHPGRAAEQGFPRGSARLQQVLAIVEDDQRPLFGEVGDGCLQRASGRTAGERSEPRPAPIRAAPDRGPGPAPPTRFRRDSDPRCRQPSAAPTGSSHIPRPRSGSAAACLPAPPGSRSAR